MSPLTDPFADLGQAPTATALFRALVDCSDPTNRRDPSGAQDLVEEEETLVVEGELEESALSEEAQMVRQFGQMHADLGKEHLLGYLREGELEALQRAPWLERMYLGTAIHRAVAADLEALGFVYNTIGPAFAIGDLLVELTHQEPVQRQFGSDPDADTDHGKQARDRDENECRSHLITARAPRGMGERATQAADRAGPRSDAPRAATSARCSAQPMAGR